jgi:hypothetical protein
LRVNDFPAEPLYSIMVDGTVLADLEDWPSAWQRPAMPTSLDRIMAWAVRLCTLATSNVGEVIDALGIAGTIEHQSTGSAVVQPPPLGTVRLSIGKTRGALSDITAILSVNAATRHDVDIRFGRGDLVPALGPGRPVEFAYRVTRPDAPYSVTLFARFDTPTESAALLSVLLRREPAPAS